jgi:hypothetical protein
MAWRLEDQGLNLLVHSQMQSGSALLMTKDP